MRSGRAATLLSTSALCAVGLVFSAAAYTPAEIDQAAIVAGQVEEVVTELALDLHQGRNNNTAASLAVQNYLIAKLALVSNGMQAGQVGDAAFKQAFVSGGQTGTNLLGVIPGTDLADEYVMVGAHYDHLGVDSSRGDIYNGATDNASGVAAVLALGAAIQSLPSPPRRSIILALWDAEEDDRIGSGVFAATPVGIAITDIVTYINFDVVGSNLTPSLRDFSFAIAGESGGTTLRNMVANAIAEQQLDIRQMSRAGGQDRSDHSRFIGQIPVVWFSDATGACYHDRDDEIGNVDFQKLREQSQTAFRLAVDLAETSTPPPFVPTSPLACTYDDVLVVSEILNGGVADLQLFDPSTQQTILNHKATVDAIVSAGPTGFSCSANLIALANAIQGTLNALIALRCDGFGPLSLAKQATPSPVSPGQTITYSLTVENVGPFDVESVELEDAVPANTTYVPGSASDGGSESGGVVSWPALTVSPAQIVNRSFSVSVDPGLVAPPAVGFSDDVESGGASWATSHGAGSSDWQIVQTRAYSGGSAWFAEDVAVLSDQRLASAAPYAVPSGGAVLSFHHDYDLERVYDGGVVEISTDGLSWSDLGPFAIENGYDRAISACCSNPLGGRQGFTGSSHGFIRSRFDLGSFADSNVWIRFRLGTDTIDPWGGWWIDDIEMGAIIANDARVDAGGAATTTAHTATHLVPEPGFLLQLGSGLAGLACLARRRCHARGGFPHRA